MHFVGDEVYVVYITSCPLNEDVLKLQPMIS